MGRKRYTVTIREVFTGGGEWTTRVLAADVGEATDRAVLKRFGRKCFWHPDSGVRGLGQVFEDEPNRGNWWSASARTMRARLDVSPGW
jgi:hypothetical protein